MTNFQFLLKINKLIEWNEKDKIAKKFGHKKRTIPSYANEKDLDYQSVREKYLASLSKNISVTSIFIWKHKKLLIFLNSLIVNY